MTGHAWFEGARIHRAQRRQATLDRLRKAAETDAHARRLLEQIDPRGDLQYWPEKENGE
jgi:hypothetical protein